ncbi:MAG: ureidoglycolate lyase [Pseudomonadota bacterium]
MTDAPSLIAETISAAAFAPFGDVLMVPSEFGRNYYDSGLGNTRDGAVASLFIAHIAATPALPVTATEMERHEFSSQSFIPMDASRYLIAVAPHRADGKPDAEKARAFIVPGSVGITYGVNVWHHPIIVLDRPAKFAVQMWRDGSSTDEEFVKLEQPFRIEVPVDV